MTSEKWRPVVGYEGLYEISSEGKVARVDGRFRLLKQSLEACYRLFTCEIFKFQVRQRSGNHSRYEQFKRDKCLLQGTKENRRRSPMEVRK